MARFAAIIANTWAIVYPEPEVPGIQPGDQSDRRSLPGDHPGSAILQPADHSGDVTQTATAFGQVEGALSFFRLAYDDFASYRASLNRLTGLLDVNDEARLCHVPVIEEREAGLGIRDLDVRLPDGRPLLTDLDLDPCRRGTGCEGPVRKRQDHPAAQPGRALAVRRRNDLAPEPRPHLVLCAAAVPAARQLARGAGLSVAGRDPQRRRGSRHAACRSARVSGRSAGCGDRLVQDAVTRRAAAACVRPDPPGAPSLAFLDETTSALDEGMEHALYELVRERLPECTIVSVGHGSTLDNLHTNELTWSAMAAGRRGPWSSNSTRIAPRLDLASAADDRDK